MVTLNLVGLDEGVHPFTLSPTAEDAGLPPEQFDALHLEGTMDYREDRVFVNFDVRATAHLVCDRTLEPFDEEVAGHYAVLFAENANALADDERDDVRPFAKEDKALDLTDAVRDTLMLALPMRRIAPSARDLDLPTQYGEEGDESNDPRWDALRDLRDQTN